MNLKKKHYISGLILVLITCLIILFITNEDGPLSLEGTGQKSVGVKTIDEASKRSESWINESLVNENKRLYPETPRNEQGEEAQMWLDLYDRIDQDVWEAWEWAKLNLSEEDLERSLRVFLPDMLKSDLSMSENIISQLPEGSLRDKYYIDLAQLYGEKDIENAYSWLKNVELGSDVKDEAFTSIVLEHIQKNPLDALQVIWELEDGDYKSQLAGRVAYEIEGKERAEFINWLDTVDNKNLRVVMRAALAQKMQEEDTLEALRVYMNSPKEDQYSEVISPIFNRLIAEDRNEGLKLLDQIQNTSAKLEATRISSIHNYELDPEKAISWAASRATSDERDQAYRGIIQSMQELGQSTDTVQMISNIQDQELQKYVIRQSLAYDISRRPDSVTEMSEKYAAVINNKNFVKKAVDEIVSENERKIDSSEYSLDFFTND